MKTKEIEIDNLKIIIQFKKIKNLNLKVKLNQQIILSAPIRASEIELRRFLESRLDWIKNAVQKFEKANTKDFYFLGEKLEVRFIDSESLNPTIEVSGGFFNIYINLGVPEKTRNRKIEKFYESKLIEVTQEFFEKWESQLSVYKSDLIIKKMKGKWGYCNIKTKEICLNTELIKKNIDFIEYVVLHEICHLLVPNHGPKFKALLDKHMPSWRKIKSDID